MSFDPVASLRDAGVLSESAPEALVESFRGLTEQETRVLISLKDKISSILPEVSAHMQDWSSPTAVPVGTGLETSCFCGAWSGSGSGAN